MPLTSIHVHAYLHKNEWDWILGVKLRHLPRFLNSPWSRTPPSRCAMQGVPVEDTNLPAAGRERKPRYSHCFMMCSLWDILGGGRKSVDEIDPFVLLMPRYNSSTNFCVWKFCDCNFEAFWKLWLYFCNRARTWLAHKTASDHNLRSYFCNHKPTCKICKKKVHDFFLLNYGI